MKKMYQKRYFPLLTLITSGASHWPTLPKNGHERRKNPSGVWTLPISAEIKTPLEVEGRPIVKL